MSLRYTVKNIPQSIDPEVRKVLLFLLGKYDIMTAAVSDPKPSSFASMKESLVKGVARHYTVSPDEVQGVDEAVYYFNGERLYLYGVPIAEEFQPTFD